VKFLRLEELKQLIAETVAETMEDFIEDIEALRSEGFVRSVEEAREDYRSGRTETLEQVLGGKEVD
jgi:hypothetical protein